MTETVLRKPWAAALKAAAIEGFRFHDLRHTRGTRILRATGNLKAAQRALAHKSIKTMLRYAHATDEDVRRALDASESRPIPDQPEPSRKKRSDSVSLGRLAGPGVNEPLYQLS
jgi:hypothetical protein